MTFPTEAPFEIITSFNVTAVTANTTTSLGGVTAFKGPYPRSVRLAVGAADVRVKFGDSTVVADLTTSALVLANSVEVFTIPPSATHIALIRNAATDSAVNVTTGRGQ